MKEREKEREGKNESIGERATREEVGVVEGVERREGGSREG